MLVSFIFTQTDPANEVATSAGTVPFVAQWVVSEPGTTDAAWTTAGGLNDADYETTELIEIADFLQITDLNCNTKFKIMVTRSGWTVPADYMTAGGKRSVAGATSGVATQGADDDSDILVKGVVNNDGYTADDTNGLATSIGSFTALSNTTPTEIFTGGRIGADTGHGVEGAQGDIDVQILMDWVQDIVGAYSISLTIDIVQVTS